MFDINLRMSEAKIIADKLLESNKYDFDGLKPSDLESGLPVVYVVFDKKSGECLYVGRTKNLRQRLYTNHLMGNKSNARLKKYLIDDEYIPEVYCKDKDKANAKESLEKAKDYLKQHCYFQVLPEKDKDKRGRIEGLLSYLLKVRYIHEEH